MTFPPLKFFLSLSGVIFFLFAAVFLFGMAKSSWALTETQLGVGEDDIDLQGFAWSATTGWISFCGGRDAANCEGQVPYKTWLNNINGQFKGYAWSSQLGYLSFNRSETGAPPEGDDCPAITGVGSALGCIHPINKRAAGWARFLGACDTFPCQSGPGSNTGNWDGWIRLSDSQFSFWPALRTFPGDATYRYGYLGQWAWESISAGWLNFRTPQAAVSASEGADLHVKLRAAPSAGRVPLTVTLEAEVFTNSSRPVTYAFDCDNGGAVTSSISNIHRCVYTAPSSDGYKPNVIVRQDSIFGEIVVNYLADEVGTDVDRDGRDEGEIIIRALPGGIKEIPPEEIPEDIFD